MNNLFKYIFTFTIVLNLISNLSFALPNCGLLAIKHKCFGEFHYNDGEYDIKYQGEFSKNSFHGEGKISYSSSILSYLATGEFKSGLLDGYATVELLEGVYKGYLKKGKFHGRGEWTSNEGHKVVARFKDGILSEGTGTMAIAGYSGGNYFTGNFKDGKPNGWGYQQIPDGGIIYALFREGKYIKYDHLIHPNGNYYDVNGHFIDFHKRKTTLFKAFNKLSHDARKFVQYALKDMGYYTHSIDGIWGKGTSSALIKYTKLKRSLIIFFEQSFAEKFLKNLALIGLGLNIFESVEFMENS